MAKIPSAKFNSLDRPEFFKVLRGRVNDYFVERNITTHANLQMWIKTAFMICLYFVPLIIMLTGIIKSVWIVMLLWALMGFGMSGIGLSIMHDANHGSYSKNKRVNTLLGYLINFVGGNHINWKIQHNVLHHSFTNIHELDGDLESVTFRFSPNQENKYMYRFQAFYAPFLYGLQTLYWLISKDFEQVVRYNKKNLLEGQGTNFKKALTQIIFNKTWYVVLTIILPIIFIPVLWWQVLLGFLLMHFICGLTLALIFQPAHVIEETEFFQKDEEGSVENGWAIHQLRTTANFARKSRIFSWFVGGLNFQIEHHLFPNICHIHYKKISHIVKKTAEEFDLPYHQHNTFYQAVKSHFALLYSLGTGEYDKALASSKIK